MRDTLEARVLAQATGGDLARPDGYVYAVDVGDALVYAAKRGRADLYDALRRVAVDLFILEPPDDPRARGFVAWRRKPGTAPDASGTTEALRLAAGLWAGAQAFARPADRDLALELLRGYGRHAATEHGQWYVRNYYNLETKAYADDSFLVDYDPDLLAAVSREVGELDDLARHSYELVSRSVAPSGLIYSMFQPGVATLMPALSGAAFAPNDLVQLNSTCTVAEVVAHGAPSVALAFLDFARDRVGDLGLYYRARTGERVGDTRAEVTTWSCLVRVAAAVGDRELARRFAREALPRWRAFARYPSEPRLYVAGEILTALQAVLED
jgi:hypothetical protein